MKQFDKLYIIPAILFVAILFVIILLKSICVPITYDEVSSALYYPKFSVWQIMMYPDDWPSNHILNSILIKFSFSLFGNSLFAERLPNVLSFLLYAGAVWSLAKRYFQSSVFLYYAVFVCFLCNPFLLDFFGLARGYGMSNALMLMSVYFCLRYAEEGTGKPFWLAWAFALLAAYANFTLLIFFVSLDGVLFLLMAANWLQKKVSLSRFLTRISLLILSNLLFAAVCYNPIHKMQSTNQFSYWTSNGFFKDTLLNLVENSRYGVRYFGIQSIWFAWIISLLFTAMAALCIIKIFRSRLQVFSNLFVISFSLLALTIATNQLQTILLKTPNLTGRTAISYYPLFIAAFLFILREGNTLFPRLVHGFSILLIVLGITHETLALNMKMVREWWYDQNTYDVLSYLNDFRLKNHEQKVQLNTSWWFNPSFSYYIQTRKLDWLALTPYHKDVDTTSNTQFYYIMGDDWSQLQNHYDPVLRFDGGARMLILHK